MEKNKNNIKIPNDKKCVEKVREYAQQYTEHLTLGFFGMYHSFAIVNTNFEIIV